MIDISNYSQVFPQDAALPSSYSSARVKAIERNRQKYHKTLFFDRICGSLGAPQIRDAYPPRDERALRVLHRKITETKLGQQQKGALLFYVLLDLQLGARAGEEAERFTKSIGLGRSYVNAILGFWEMDRLEYRVYNHFNSNV